MIFAKDSHNLYVLNTKTLYYHLLNFYEPKPDWFANYARHLWSASPEEFLTAGNDIWQILI